MADEIKIVIHEAQILSRYLIGHNCTDQIAAHYVEAINKHNAVLTDSQQSTWEEMLSSDVYMKLVDSGLAISNPQSALRKRIFIMLALLEASPDYTEFFLPQPRGGFYLIKLGFRAGVSVIYTVFGTLTVKILSIH